MRELLSIDNKQVSTIYKIVADQAKHSPEETALLAPGRTPLSYAGLLEQVDDAILTLSDVGIGRRDTVAIVLPNGPEMAATFLAAASAAISAPLNPSYRMEEFEFYLSDLQARVLIVQAGIETPASAAARALNIPIVELHPLLEGPAGRFELHLPGGRSPVQPAPAASEDIALVLHTSGTTSRPKLVPLSQANLCCSAESIRDWLQLSPQDRCLNIMPLFHIHGLAAALLATLAAGGSLVCPPGFNLIQFFGWLDEFKPTWYTAVPTMHQAILGRTEANEEIIARSPLRFIRSCSSSLPPQVMADLERTFRAPVVEAYGMTEAAHQMTCNPLPPLERKPGSVGLPSGPQVRIMAEDCGDFQPAGVKGEIVIRGSNVTSGYLNNPLANKKAFTDGWFRTGDQGTFDEQGYLYITGRLKEIINRGGEKISPREIDEVLLDHPAVYQALTFAVPDPLLGEQVAAAVVLRDRRTTERDLRSFASTRLVDFKVPRRILILDEIPKGATGKLQRIGLAEKLGLSHADLNPQTEASQPYAAPRNRTEHRLAEIWRRTLGIEQVSIRQTFTELGGDSLLMLQLALCVEEEFKLNVSLLDLSDAGTIESQAAMLDRLTCAE